MALIQFSKADTLRAQDLENEKWYSWQIARVEGPKSSGKGDSYNYNCILSLIDVNEELNGKEIGRTFNTKAMAMMIPLIAAVRGKAVSDFPKEAFDFDTDELVGKRIDGKHTLEPYEGRMVGRVETFAPYKSIVGKAQSF